ncbi:MAG: LysE family translocator [Alphaproteobacteria bacterium]|nr:LysE family translocator [Alphaproteobacteria bacterium]
MDEWIGFLLAGIALTGSPGPATLSIAATGAAFGRGRGFPYYLGIQVGMILVMVITASGAAGLVLAVPGVRPVVAIVVTAYFAYLAYRIATAPPLSDTHAKRHPPRLVAGVLLSLANPKAYAAMAALFSGFVLIADAAMIDATVKLAVLIVIIAAVDLGWLFAGAALTRVFRDRTRNRIVNIAFAVLLIVSIVFALVV